jgi:hypothetical protein
LRSRGAWAGSLIAEWLCHALDAASAALVHDAAGHLWFSSCLGL